ncbi:uncharacterized protein F5Z01DRAFT_667956 [Emericellopsis atlantica]|uniref:Uncharacterized protein n=1 Tax=Emericellopsis atlantica TaxID=2614577 RepID=A0A9P7ZEC2_9HYPO|nr:uncharacterized protein F5Z01DRAFT_667956 [Emericellopsis atlantica]KAG9249903.1 hypothetical protein F5Z01DRAFT_667956 [Emericellopsis atlantica]
MGRKKAVPQPLSIPHTNLNITSKTTSSATTSNPPEPTAAAQAISAANTLTPTPGTASSTSTGLSPSDSRSPASASTRISPFSSRFAQKRPQTARAGQPSKTTDFDQFDRRRPSQPSVQGPAQSQKAAAYPHIASTYNPSSTSLRSVQSASQSQTPTQGQQPQKQVQHEPKKSRGFFHFAKPSKSFTQFTSQPSSHNSTPSRDEAQPVELERADTSGSNQAGTCVRALQSLA